MFKGGQINLIDAIVGILLVIAGAVTFIGKSNLGALLAGIGLVIEAIKMLGRFGP